MVIRSPLYGKAAIVHFRSSLYVEAYLMSDANMVGTLTIFSEDTKKSLSVVLMGSNFANQSPLK
uniref:Uncharacterized protein n=1 Tax=Lepeophtheirus salmonis TaxID=72036 RepID=A0A0K2V170_LEPSM